MTDYRQPPVALFQTVFKQWDGEAILSSPVPKNETELATYKLRLKLCIEETFELFEAMLTEEAYKPFGDLLNNINANIASITMKDMEVDVVEVFDSLVDQDYVNIGFANLLGLDMEAGFKEVQRSNMSKLDENGQPIFRADGKVLKSSLYKEPDLKAVYETTSYKHTPLPKSLTVAGLNDKIVKTNYIVEDTTTLCILTLENGYKVIGEASCISPENFDKDIGERLAYQRAFDQIGKLEGYLLKEHIYREQ